MQSFFTIGRRSIVTTYLFLLSRLVITLGRLASVLGAECYLSQIMDYLSIFTNSSLFIRCKGESKLSIYFIKVYLSNNVPHGRVAHTGELPTFAKTPPKPLYYGIEQPTLGLYYLMRHKILFIVYFYHLLIHSSVMPYYIILSTLLLRQFTYFSAYLFFYFLPITTRPKVYKSGQALSIFNY